VNIKQLLQLLWRLIDTRMQSLNIPAIRLVRIRFFVPSPTLKPLPGLEFTEHI
jgi:hypothetical protein